jgi:DNA-binding NtrC family response regulator
MEKKILILDDHSAETSELIQKLTDAGFIAIVCQKPEEIEPVISKLKPSILIAASEFSDVRTEDTAVQVYETHNIPAFLIVNAAGESTQTFFRQHPGFIGVLYKPLNVEKLIIRLQKFFDQ